MKKLFAIVAVIGAFTFGSIQLAQAQDAPAAEQTEQQAAPAAAQAPPAPAGDAGNRRAGLRPALGGQQQPHLPFQPGQGPETAGC